LDDYNFQEYDFENPPRIQAIAEALVCGIAGGYLYNRLIKALDLKGDEKILDFGCGGGFLAKRLMKSLNEKGRLTCLDSSSFYIKKAKKRLSRYDERIEFIAKDIREAEISDGSFDIIVINYVLHDIKPGKRSGLIKILARKLQYGKKLCIHEPTKPDHGISLEELNSLFSNAGLVQKDFDVFRSQYIGCWEKV